jgi:hypothetical protein
VGMSKWQVEMLGFEVAKDLVRSGAVEADIDALSDMVRRVVADDLAVEEALDAEVHEMLKKLAATMRAQNVDYAIMFEKVKKQLVRERKLIL